MFLYAITREFAKNETTNTQKLYPICSMTTLRFDKIIEMKRLVVAKRAGGCRCGSKITAGWSPWVENVLSLGCIRVNLLAGMFCSFCKMLPLMELVR